MGSAFFINGEHARGLQPTRRWVRAFAWAVACIALLNVLCFVLRSTNPVIRSDAWYTLDVFLRKAMNGSLGFADFFTRRYVDDHGQPLVKLVLLLEWRFFDLDYAVEAVLGVTAAAACALILHRVVMGTNEGARADTRRLVAWVAMAAVLFSLNASGTWAWPLAAVGYVTIMLVMLYILVVWHAWQNHRYLLLIVATILLCAVADDVSLIAEISVLMALLVLVPSSTAQSRASIGKVILVVLICTLLIRVAYAFSPLLDSTPGAPLSERLALLFGYLRKGDGWQWIVIPLSLSVASNDPFNGPSAQTWAVVQEALAGCLLIAHVAFWWRALNGRHNVSTFMAVCLMLFSYGLLAGIILVRVPHFGSSYLSQDRYVALYQFNLIALLLMWAGASSSERPHSSWRRWLALRVPMAGCVLLLLLQIPLAQGAWQERRYSLPYYGRMATQIGQLAMDPTQTRDCLPELVVCHWPLERRRAALDLLRSQRLNVFSARVQAWHRFLPHWPTDTKGHAP